MDHLAQINVRKRSGKCSLSHVAAALRRFEEVHGFANVAVERAAKQKEQQIITATDVFGAPRRDQGPVS